MVLEANKQYHAVNKYIIAFINNSKSLSDEVKTALISEWKNTSGAKLKTTMHKSHTKTPRRRISSYLYFCADERAKIKMENPSLNIEQCTCLLGQRWREFQQNPDPIRMATYIAKADADKKRYEDEKKLYEGDEVPLCIDAPVKRQRSAYLNYCAARRAVEPKISMKLLGAGWALVKANPAELALYSPLTT